MLQSLGILVGGFALYLITVALLPGISAPAQRLTRTKPSPDPEDDLLPVSKEVVSFIVDDASIRGWLYLPEAASAPVPCIVMAHGLGGTLEMGLDQYARRFQAAGFAVLAFDYRCFGASGGEPRQLIWIPHQLEDLNAAIGYARGRPEIDADRIGLWGTSLGGGHVLVAAAQDYRIVCVVAQCPGLDGRAGAELGMHRDGLGHGLRLVMHGQRDLVRSWLGLSPYRIPIVGRPGSVALMTTSQAFAAFERLAPEGYVNEACARITIRGDKYRPITYARDVRCPVLLQICELDDLTPISAAEATARKLGSLAQVIRYPIGHFDIYFGENFTRSVHDQLTFFKRHLFDSATRQ